MRTVKSFSRNARGDYEVAIAGDDGVVAPFRLSEDLVVEYRLLPGRTLEEADYRRLLSDADADGLYGAALRSIARAPRTSREIRAFLAARTEDPTLADRVYAKLLAKGYVDDLAYALAYVDYHFGTRRDGPVKLRFDLERKGVFRDYVEEAVSGLDSKAVARNLACLFDRRLPQLSSRPRAKAVRAMKTHLLQRGYDPSVAIAYVDGRLADFPAGEDEEKKAATDLVKARKRLSAKGIDGHALRAKLIQALMNKGYRYDTIRRVIDKEEDDES
ncbi:MAG: RecX family transcriptional regulator [Candidatus Izemoplasmatales bacterium]